MTTKTWPFEDDADRDDPLTALRIPVTGAYPSFVYLAAFDRGSEERPSDAEAAVISSWIDLQREWFNETWQAKLLERPLDVEGGHNTVIFHKWGEGDWGYRRRTHRYGPTFWPGRPGFREGVERAPYALVDLMDHMQGRHTGFLSQKWIEWKAARPEVFGA